MRDEGIGEEKRRREGREREMREKRERERERDTSSKENNVPPKSAPKQKLKPQFLTLGLTYTIPD
jgi:hypothetical protein